jgi:hypothetical protein
MNGSLGHCGAFRTRGKISSLISGTKYFFLRANPAFVDEVSSERNNCKMSEGKKNTKKAAATSSPTKKSQYQLYQDLEKNVDVGKT